MTKLSMLWTRALQQFPSRLYFKSPDFALALKRAHVQARGVDAHEKCLNLREELTESHKQRGEHIRNCSAKLGADIAELRVAYEGGNKDVRSDIKVKTGKVSIFYF